MPDSSSPDRPTFFPQEAPNTCAVACLRMVLSAFGVIRSESDLAALARTDEFGTEIGNLVKAAETLGFECDAGVFDWETLGRTRFPIVYLDGLTLGRTYLMHAVVIAELNQVVRMLDPAQGELDLPKGRFMEAWEAAGSYAVTIRPGTRI